MAKNNIACSEENCQRPVVARGMCSGHYQRAKRHSSGWSDTEKHKICEIENCLHPVLARGLCNNHYQIQMRKGFEPLPRKLCGVKNCNNVAIKKRRCAEHYEKLTLTRSRKAPDIWLFVDKSGGADACWPWTGQQHNRQGYGQKNVNRKTVLAHRLMWEHVNGPIPEGLLIRHKCDNPPCVNPSHLELGTHKDNTRDMWDRGRHPVFRGEDNAKATQTDDSVIEMIKMRKLGHTYESIARRFNIYVGTAWQIINGKTWKHIDRSLITVDS